MPPFISPLNQTAKSPLDQSEEEKPTWEQFLNALDEKRPIKRLVKHKGAIILSREYNKQRKNAVWTKTYQPVKDLDLSVFNEWECELITRVHNLSVKGCYKPAELIITGTPLQHTDDTPVNLRQSRKTIIKTVHGGPELYHWQSMNLCVNQEPVPHPFVAPANFLLLAQGILKALYHFHSEGFFHCDLNPGNLVLPALAEGQNSANKKVALTSRNLEKIKITPQWDKLILIDLGFSLSRNSKPYTTLPLDTNKATNPRMSAHLRGRLIDIESQAKERLTRLGSQQSWGEVCHDKKFWNKWADSPLKLLQEFDWREDLHQLGFLLKDIRDSWGGDEHIKLSNPTLSQLIYSLPERLLAWGDPAQLDQPAPKEMPHLKLISEIDSALAQAQDKDRQDTFFLYRADNDPDYAARQKSGEERRQHWLRPWRMFRESLASLGQNAWANFFNQHPLLVQLTLSYPVFVFLAIALDKDAIGLPVGGTAALAILIVLGLAVRKLTGLIAYGASRFLMVLVDLLGNLAHSFSIRWRRGWRNAVALWNKLPNLIQNAWGYFINRKLLVAFTSFFLFLIVLFGTLSVSEKYPESMRDSTSPTLPILTNPVENLNNPISSEALAHLQKAAEAGDIERQVYLGKMYFLGKGVSADLVKGALWLDKAATQGDARLKTDIAKLYQKTEHVDYEIKAFEWLQKAAANDFPEAQYELAITYKYGIGVAKNIDEAFDWMQKAANQDYDKAQFELGAFYDYKKNYPTIQWLKKAADQGNANAQGALAYYYWFGIGVKKSEDEALIWATKGDAQEDAQAQYILGLIYDRRSDHKKAFTQFQKAAAQDAPYGQLSLGEYYFSGKGTKLNEAEAIKWFKKAAAHNSATAQFALASTYMKQNNNKEALYWLREAATRGHAQAEYQLCNIYHDGKLTEKNYYKTFEWCQKAAAQGLQLAQFLLGILYRDALGTQRDIVRAYAWFALAANQADRESEKDTYLITLLSPGQLALCKRIIKDMEEYLTPKQLADAKYLAASLKKDMALETKIK